MPNVDRSTTIPGVLRPVEARRPRRTRGLTGAELDAWRSYLHSHVAITRVLDAELEAGHGLTLSDYEVLLYLVQAREQRLRMSELAERVMLTKSGISRLVDGLERSRLVQRVACREDARVSYAQLTDSGYEKLREAARTHLNGVRRLFLAHFSEKETEGLAALLSRLPGVSGGPCSVE